MKRFFFWSFLFFAGCSSQNGSNSEKLKDASSTSKIIGCYISIFKNDTSNLNINVNNGHVWGKLSYKRFEKDSNSGILNGKVQDSLIIGDYSFKSEGITSVREVVFKISGENLLEGYGDMVITKNGDSAKFKNLSNLNFQEDQPFVKKECD